MRKTLPKYARGNAIKGNEHEARKMLKGMLTAVLVWTFLYIPAKIAYAVWLKR